ncbi:Mannan endo-1,4-beta-mannosidase 7 [Linum perenne]
MMGLALCSILSILLLNHHHHTFIAAVAAAGDSFIKTRGTHFLLNGDLFYANGFNAYWLMYVASDPSQRSKVSAAFQEAKSHDLTVARTWAFSDGGYRPLQYAPGSYNQDMFKGLDFVVSEARSHGVKLIMSLANNYDSFGGKKQYVNWARAHTGRYLASDDEFFTDSVVKGYYKNHIQTVLNRKNTFTGIRYKDDPTIMAWELMNEPRCTSDSSGRTIQMAFFVKSIDRNHLLEVGTDFIANNRVPAIDFATVHSYPDQWLSNANEQSQLSFMNNWLNAHIQDAQYILGKPIIIAEFGKSWKDRDQMFNAVYYKIYSSAKRGGAAAGGLFWQLLTEGMDSFRDGYEVVLGETTSTTNLIRQQSHKLYQIRKIFARIGNQKRWKIARAAARKNRSRNGGRKGIGN